MSDDDDALHTIKVGLTYVRRKLNKVLAESEGVNFTDEEREFMADSLGRLRVQLDALADHLRQIRG